jgi:hypothetical protein
MGFFMLANCDVAAAAAHKRAQQLAKHNRTSQVSTPAN